MIDANKILQELCDKYSAAVSANNSTAYGKLFAKDAIRIPPGSDPEHGPDKISQSEQKDYDVAKWACHSTALDALRIDDEWIYGIAQAKVNTISHADGKTNSFKVYKTWLLHREDSGEWLIKRQMWNLK